MATRTESLTDAAMFTSVLSDNPRWRYVVDRFSQSSDEGDEEESDGTQFTWSSLSFPRVSRCYIWTPEAFTEAMSLRCTQDVDILCFVGVPIFNDDEEYQLSINMLHSYSRSDIADALAVMRHNSDEDPDEWPISGGVQLQLAQFFIGHTELPIPFLVSAVGVIYAEWGVYEDGVFVIGFLGPKGYCLVINVDSDRHGNRVLISKSATEDEIIESIQDHWPLLY